MQFEKLPEQPSNKSPWINLFAALFVLGGMFGMSRITTLFLTPAQIEPVLTTLQEASERTQYMPLKEAEREHLALLFSQTEIQIRSMFGMDSENDGPADPYGKIFLYASLFFAAAAILAGKGLKGRHEWARILAVAQVLLNLPIALRALSLAYTKNLNSDRLQNLLIQLHFFSEDSVPGLRELATAQMGVYLFCAVFWFILVFWFFTRRSIRKEFR